VTNTRPPSPGSPRHAPGDGSFGRSVASAGGRGAILVAIAVVVGIVLLITSDDGDQALITADGELTEVHVADDVVGGSTGSTGTTASTLPGETTTTPPATTEDGSTVSTAPPVIDRTQIRVIVYNAAGVQGIAGAQSDELRTLGYAVADPATSDTQLADTRIYAVAGKEPACEAVKTDVQTINTEVDLTALIVQPADPATTPVTGYDGLADCIVVIGQDLAATAG
jgi:hypothetical protein